MKSTLINMVAVLFTITLIASAGVGAVKDMLEAEDVTFFHDLALVAQNAMENNAARAMSIFSLT